MFLAVSGNIGAGKSTLVNRLAEHYHCRAELEAVKNNPYLNDFYDDMARWAFPLQVYFLNQRFRQGLAVRQSTDCIILDRTVYEDAEVFARNLHQLGHMGERDYQNYRGLYESMRSLLPVPNLVIYLQASVATLQQRIAQRNQTADPDRRNEGKILPAYLEQLNRRYEAWIQNFSESKVLTINIDLVDLADAKAYSQLIEAIDRQLS